MKLQIQIIISINILLITSSCKTFKGSYCTPPNYTGACIEFLNKKELLYHTGTDYGTSHISYGIYEVEKDTLLIEFAKIPENYKLKSNEKYELINFEEIEKDSIKLEIELEGSWSANVFYKEVKSDSIYWVNSITPDNQLNIVIPKSQLPINLHTEYKKSKVVVPIEKSGNYKIRITLNELLGGLSYNHWMTITSKYSINKEGNQTYFEQIGNENWGKYYKFMKKNCSVNKRMK